MVMGGEKMEEISRSDGFKEGVSQKMERGQGCMGDRGGAAGASKEKSSLLDKSRYPRQHPGRLR